jgi:hypothetical protein
LSAARDEQRDPQGCCERIQIAWSFLRYAAIIARVTRWIQDAKKEMDPLPMIHAVDPDEQITIEPAEAALMLHAYLEMHGAGLSLDAEQRLRVDLDPLPNVDPTRADRLARLVLSVRDELRGSAHRPRWSNRPSNSDGSDHSVMRETGV